MRSLRCAFFSCLLVGLGAVSIRTPKTKDALNPETSRKPVSTLPSSAPTIAAAPSISPLSSPFEIVDAAGVSNTLPPEERSLYKRIRKVIRQYSNENNGRKRKSNAEAVPVVSPSASHVAIIDTTFAPHTFPPTERSLSKGTRNVIPHYDSDENSDKNKKSKVEAVEAVPAVSPSASPVVIIDTTFSPHTFPPTTRSLSKGTRNVVRRDHSGQKSDKKSNDEAVEADPLVSPSASPVDVVGIVDGPNTLPPMEDLLSERISHVVRHKSQGTKDKKDKKKDKSNANKAGKKNNGKKKNKSKDDGDDKDKGKKKDKSNVNKAGKKNNGKKKNKSKDDGDDKDKGKKKDKSNVNKAGKKNNGKKKNKSKDDGGSGDNDKKKDSSKKGAQDNKDNSDGGGDGSDKSQSDEKEKNSGDLLSGQSDSNKKLPYCRCEQVSGPSSLCYSVTDFDTMACKPRFCEARYECITSETEEVSSEVPSATEEPKLTCILKQATKKMMPDKLKVGYCYAVDTDDWFYAPYDGDIPFLP